MKVTMYELLRLVKDGKAPKKIKINNDILTLSKATIIQYNFERMGHLNWDYYIENDMLNEKIVEILDDEEKGLPEKLEGIDSLFEIGQDLDLKSFLAWQKSNNKIIKNKINEIIDYLEKQRKGE